MPGGDRTGPMGTGPMTGRRAGFCSGSGQPGYASPGWGRGRGFFSAGIPRGAGRWRVASVGAAPLSSESEKRVLQEQAEQLQETLESIRQRLDELGSSGS